MIENSLLLQLNWNSVSSVTDLKIKIVSLVIKYDQKLTISIVFYANISALIMFHEKNSHIYSLYNLP